MKNIHYNEHILSYSFQTETLVFFTKFHSSYFYFKTPDSYLIVLGYSKVNRNGAMGGKCRMRVKVKGALIITNY